MKAHHFPPAFAYAIELRWRAVDDIVARPRQWADEEALRLFVESGLPLGTVKQLFSHKAAVDRDEATASIEPVIAHMQEEHENWIRSNPDLAALFRELYERRDELDLTERDHAYLERKYRSFARAGAYLTDVNDRKALAEYNDTVSFLQAEYKDNQQREMERFEFRVDDVEKLNGLTDDQIAAARSRAGDSGGYLLPPTADVSSIWHPYLPYLTDPEVSKDLYEAVAKMAVGGDYDNSANVLGQVSASAKRAALTGYDSHADYVLSGGIFDSVRSVEAIAAKLAHAAAAATRVELPRLAEAIGTEIRPWNRARALDVLIKNGIGIDEQHIRQYFELDRVLVDGVFGLAKDMFGLTITELDGDRKPSVWHSDVRVFSVLDEDGHHLTHFYLDPYARDGKNVGAWTDPIRIKFTPAGQQPLISVHVSIHKPPTGKPTLLSPGEVSTLFHEFGHAVHFLLSEGTYEPAERHLNFAWIESVAKVFQNFWKHPDVLSRFAAHHETGEPMPQELLEKFDEQQAAYRGTITVGRLTGAVIDLALSSLSPEQVPQGPDARTLLAEFAENALTRAGINFPEIGNPYPPQWFRHLFARMGAFEDYFGRYMSYLFSDVVALSVYRRFIGPSIERYGLSAATGDLIRDMILTHEEDNLAEALRRLIGSEVSIDDFLIDQRLLWAVALDKLGAGAMPEWLTDPAARPPGTDLAAWWNTELTADERAAVIQQFPDEVLGMDIDHSRETLDAARARRDKLREYASAAPSESTGSSQAARRDEQPVTARQQDDEQPVVELGPDEIYLLSLIADGRSLAEAGKEIKASASTVRRRLDAIESKLGTHSTLESILAVWRQGMLRLGDDAVETAPRSYLEFTPGEVEILGLLARGLSNSAIAAHLAISRTVVQDRLGLLFDKLGVHGRIPAVLAALDREVVQLPSNPGPPPATPDPSSHGKSKGQRNA
ncbi:Peptidyl-dipeptidase dcp [Nocardia cyriacigeorgica]|uniref:Peptidyl-dipeptidase dcp n=1 Tax=Nocardia cyriacigeorgica TaxID=135487 RepID=A0A4U8W558_9NOCA|nr:Peptidyl-dipeptidase dcp [Nocardia cyriacigeorgica]